MRKMNEADLNSEGAWRCWALVTSLPALSVDTLILNDQP